MKRNGSRNGARVRNGFAAPGTQAETGLNGNGSSGGSGGGMQTKRFVSPSRGPMTFAEMFEDIVQYIHEAPEARYRIMIGTDSQLSQETTFVTAVIVHREGKGARYFCTRDVEPVAYRLRQRMFYEASRSLVVAAELTAKLAARGLDDLDVEIHLDVGENGETRELIKDLVGMVVGSGFDARIKPDSYGASKVADKYTK